MDFNVKKQGYFMVTYFKNCAKSFERIWIIERKSVIFYYFAQFLSQNEFPLILLNGFYEVWDLSHNKYSTHPDKNVLWSDLSALYDLLLQPKLEYMVKSMKMLPP